jgi:hypothetical protein
MLQNARATLAVFVTLAGLSCGMTLLYLGMRAVMDIGGACASGGPYVPRVECPEGVPLLMMAGIWGGLIFLGLYLWATSKHHVPTLVGFSWSALFLSLGWNFLDFGLDPPFGEGPVWGWVVCAIAFGLMGGLPLFAFAGPIMSQFTKGPPAPHVPTYVMPTANRVKDARAAQRAAQRSAKPRPPAATRQEEDETLVDALERLERMHRSGALTDREFEDAKRRVIRGQP